MVGETKDFATAGTPRAHLSFLQHSAGTGGVVEATCGGTRAGGVGQASLPASSGGIPAARFHGRAPPRNREHGAGMPRQLAGRDACPTRLARTPSRVQETEMRRYAAAPECGRPRRLRHPHARGPWEFSHAAPRSIPLRPSRARSALRLPLSAQFTTRICTASTTCSPAERAVMTTTVLPDWMRPSASRCWIACSTVCSGWVWLKRITEAVTP